MSESGAKKNKNIAYWINSAIVFLLMFGIGQLPPFGQVTPLGMQILGIFVGVLYGWCTVSLVWPSLLSIIAVGTTEYCTVLESFSTGLGSDMVLQIFLVYIFAAYMEESGLSAFIANWFISRKIGEGRPWVFTILIFAAAYVMSSFVSTFATIIILWGIFYKICDLIGESRRTAYTGMVVAGIVIICSMTMAIFPFKAFAVIIIGLTQKAVGAIEINFVTWTIYNFVISASVIVLYVLACKFILKPDLTKVKEAGANFAHLRGAKINKEQKIAMAVLTVYILALLLPSVLPKTVPGMALLSAWGLPGVTLVCIIALAVARTAVGAPYINVPALISKGCNWELLLLIAATMPLCNALEATECGVLATVLAWMNQAFAGMSGLMFMVVIVTVFALVTQVTHNLVLVLVFTPVLTKMGLGLGLSPILVMMLVYYAAMSAFATPAASSNAALIFGNNEWVQTKHAYICGIITVVVSIITFVCIGIPLGQILL